MPHATPPHPPHPSKDEELELTTSLHEALTCTTCAITHIPKSIFHQDLTTGIYNQTRYPPFQLPSSSWNQSEKETDCIAPEELPPSPTTKPNTQIQLNPHQHQHHPLYKAQFQTYLSHDPTHDEAFAQYLTDYHIHVHYLLRRGVLGFCRDVKDVYEMKAWRGRVHEVDSGVGWQQPRSRMGWVDDGNLMMVYQMALWRKRGLGRQKRVEESRAKWAGIMEERRRQRLKLRLKQSSGVRVRLYCSQVGGDRCLLREVEVEVDG
ncbi:hypothetical protein BO94DRAFT_619522 [Aspergillus sclerotioniger CBS 115572]|uniref:Uncharacterized protein n=1 Tax=Aspergillus sclerotioniger CBS 115572 TaxID=1450535 RepID=A0A317XCP4_9EURO|nr:hypothetical protein BO94DRAFT_619522 [Aspergillus sclerotioniger CBS 115572]PWY96386.1 hypothetical protein BO94DRAFT_619522 [Aspergillus sclerotioniger CBS 115572]